MNEHEIEKLNIIKTHMGCFGKPIRMITPTCIIIHHTCTRSPTKTREVLKSRNLSTHFEVDINGNIYQYRECNEQCAHCGGLNHSAIGIDCTHLEGKPWPSVQVERVKKLVVYLCEKYNIKPVASAHVEGVYPHSAVACTKCPGGFPVEGLFDKE